MQHAQVACVQQSKFTIGDFIQTTTGKDGLLQWKNQKNKVQFAGLRQSNCGCNSPGKSCFGGSQSQTQIALSSVIWMQQNMCFDKTMVTLNTDRFQNRRNHDAFITRRNLLRGDSFGRNLCNQNCSPA